MIATMIATVNFFQWYMATILILVILQVAYSTRKEMQSERNLRDNAVKDLLFYEVPTHNAGKTHIIIKRKSDSNRYIPRPVPLPILVGGGGIRGFGRVVGRGFGARGPSGRGFAGARGIGARGVGGRGLGGSGGRGRG